MTRLRQIALQWAALGAVVITAGLAAPVQAQDRVNGEVLIILASDLPGVMDSRLRDVPALRRAPFDGYRSMQLLESPRIALAIDEPREVPLPNGRRIRLVLREITDTGRYRLNVSINRPGQQDYLPEMSVVASPGDPFFVAGQSFQVGTLVIGVRLNPRS
ncbi:MAG: hypothetical protein AB8I08_13755 [Sandaracinaceae bacterium]